MDDGTTPGRSPQEALVRALARTADARLARRRYADASRLYQRALDLAEGVFGAADGELVAILNAFAVAEGAQGREGQADLLNRRAAVLAGGTAVEAIGPPSPRDP